MPKQLNVIVTGGAGFIGGCTAIKLKGAGYHPILIDKEPIPKDSALASFPYFCVDLADQDKTRSAFEKLPTIHGIIHFAAYALVGESFDRPEFYLRNNFLSTLNLAEMASKKKVPHFVYSSSCSVYGVPPEVPILENTRFDPISPYGESKLMGERILFHMSQKKTFNVIALRYFNPAGSIENGLLGESHSPETHLIPNVVKAALEGGEVLIFGTDHPTPDGTCIRDFIHIEDLSHAHILGLQYLENKSKNPYEAINLGSGKGYSVRQIIHTTEQVLDKKIRALPKPRRMGDPPILVADNSLAHKKLGWIPKKGIEDMVRDHYVWITKNSKTTTRKAS